jgi:anti-sigma factor RsiW
MGHLILLRATRETTVNETSHLSVDEAASYIDGTLSDDAREVIERHLAECESCREEVAASARLVASVPTQARRGVPWRLVLPLAAGILVAVMIRRPASRPDAAPIERGGAADGSAIALVAPVSGAPLVAGRTRLVWRALDDSVLYNVVLKDAAGAKVWSGETADTMLAVPAGVQLRVGEQYVLRVDGQRTDGSSVSSAEVSVKASP